MTFPMDGSRLDYALELAVQIEIWRPEIEAMGWTVTESSGQTVWPVRDWAGRLQVFFARPAGRKMVRKRIIVRKGEDMGAVKSRLLKEVGLSKGQAPLSGDQLADTRSQVLRLMRSLCSWARV